METFLVPNRANNFVFRLLDDDGMPVDGKTCQIRLLRVSGSKTWQWDGSNWVEFTGVEAWHNMSDDAPGGLPDGSGLYFYYLPSSAIGAWYNQTVIALYRELTLPVYTSDVYGIVESFTQTVPESVVETWYHIDQDGWWTSDGILVPWDDEMEGYVFSDDTGDRLVNVKVAAHTVVLGEVIKTNNPAWMTLTNWQGNWVGWINPGTYRFYFFKDHFINKYVDRTVG